MATLFEQISSFLKAERSEQRFHESLRELATLRPQPPIRTSLTFDSHIEEARGSGGRSGRTPQNISLAWDDANFYGSQDVAARNWQSLTPRERKDILLNIYLNNPWVSACVDVIAKRITSGGVSIEPTVDKPDEGHLHQLEDFCLRVNDDWDILQYVRACITDELIYGDAYSETVWQKGLPYQLYKVDCLTMGYKTNRYGQITEFLQQMDTSREPQVLDSKNIIRWWFPHPRSAVEPFSPIERAQDAVNLDKKMVNWLTTFFQKGAKFPYYVKFPGEMDEADRFLQWFKQNFTGEKNAHVPLVTWGGAELVPLGKGSMDIDFEHGSDRERLIILATYHIPPAILSIIESGNLGGGTGEDQEKSFQYNTCDPIRHQYFEKFNYRITNKGFNIHDYRISTRYADYRNDKDLATVQDIRIKNGSITEDEARQEMGKTPYQNGVGSVPVIITSREMIPVPRLKDLEGEQRQTAQQTLEQGDLNTEMLKAKVDQAKNPLPPMPGMPGQPPQGGNNPPNPGKKAPTQAKEDDKDRPQVLQQQNTPSKDVPRRAKRGAI